MDVNKLLQDALAAGASDIHIEPMDDAVRIRWRRDGVLCQAGCLHKSSLEKLVSRIKVLAGLDIANRRLPQDGRIVWKDGNRRLDLRVSTRRKGRHPYPRRPAHPPGPFGPGHG